MKTVSHITRRVWLAPTVSLALLWVEIPSQAQSTANEIRRQGDAFSEKVSGFFGRVFGGGSRQASPPPYQAPVYPQGSQRQTVAPQQPAYRYAPSSGGQQTSAVPSQRPQMYREAPVASSPPAKSKSSAPVATKRPTRSNSTVAKTTTPKKRVEPEPERPVYTSTKRSRNEETPPAYTSKPSPSRETVVTAPTPPAPTKEEPAKTYTSLSSTTSKSTSTDVFPLPGKSPVPSPPKESPASAPSNSSGQEFPKGTATNKPGRVISPYEPHNELDVQGLPSGSLALDPTTQKVFKIP